LIAIYEKENPNEHEQFDIISPIHVVVQFQAGDILPVEHDVFSV
jgi:hypothetical protein